MSDRIIWTEEQEAKVHQFYIRERYTSEAVGGLLGVSGKAVRSKAARLLAGVDGRRKPEPRPRAIRVPPAPAPKPQPCRAKARAPVNFKTPEKPAAPLPDRILTELASRALSACSLASVLGEKELHVSMQLAAMAHAGCVQAGPAALLGHRHRIWSLVE